VITGEPLGFGGVIVISGTITGDSAEDEADGEISGTALVSKYTTKKGRVKDGYHLMMSPEPEPEEE